MVCNVDFMEEVLIWRIQTIWKNSLDYKRQLFVAMAKVRHLKIALEILLENI